MTTDQGRPARAVVIPTGDAPVQAREVDASKAGLWALVGGQPEIVPVGDDAAVHVHAYGKSEDLPPNPRATRLIESYRPGFANADMVMGDAVVLGFDATGSPADVPAGVEEKALRA